MALTKPETLVNSFNDEVTFKKAYLKIDLLNGNKDSMSFTLTTYKSQQEMMAVQSRLFTFSPVLENPDNFIKQAYLHLKTLPEFTDAVDC